MQMGQKNFTTAQACQSSAPTVLKLNHQYYPRTRFKGYRCFDLRDWGAY